MSASRGTLASLRRAVREARDAGARVAILFSNNDAASRAYESIGFERVGAYRVGVLKSALTVGEPS